MKTKTKARQPYICVKCKKRYTTLNRLLTHFAKAHKYNFCSRKQIPRLGKDYCVELMKGFPPVPKTDIVKEVAKEKGIPVEEVKPAKTKAADFKGLPDLSEMKFVDDFNFATDAVRKVHHTFAKLKMIEDYTKHFCKQYINEPNFTNFLLLNHWLNFAKQEREEMSTKDPSDNTLNVLKSRFDETIEVDFYFEKDETFALDRIGFRQLIENLNGKLVTSFISKTLCSPPKDMFIQRVAWPKKMIESKFCVIEPWQIVLKLKQVIGIQVMKRHT